MSETEELKIDLLVIDKSYFIFDEDKEDQEDDKSPEQKAKDFSDAVEQVLRSPEVRGYEQELIEKFLDELFNDPKFIPTLIKALRFIMELQGEMVPEEQGEQEEQTEDIEHEEVEMEVLPENQNSELEEEYQTGQEEISEGEEEKDESGQPGNSPATYNDEAEVLNSEDERVLFSGTKKRF